MQDLIIFFLVTKQIARGIGEVTEPSCACNPISSIGSTSARISTLHIILTRLNTFSVYPSADWK